MEKTGKRHLELEDDMERKVKLWSYWVIAWVHYATYLSTICG